MKKYVTLILIFALVFNFTLISASASDGGVNWYIKRNGNNQPELPKEHSVIEKYNAYYIDKKLDDIISIVFFNNAMLLWKLGLIVSISLYIPVNSAVGS